MDDLYAQLDDIISDYEKGTITISDDIEFSMRETVRQITHYILSKYMNTQKDEQGRRKPFRNIGNAIVDLEWRAKNIDRKSIEAHATDGDYIFSLVVNKELQQWMKENNFGKTIDDYQRKKSEYGDVLLKKTETADELIIEPVKWENVAVDPRDIANGPKIDRHFLTPLELKKKAKAWTEKDEKDKSGIDLAVAAAKKDKTSSGEHRIEVWDVEGEFEYADVYPDSEEENDEIALYNIIVAVVADKKFCLYKKKLTASRYKHDSRKTVEGRDMGVGVWEELFEPQIWTNEAVIAEKVAMDLAGKVILKTNKKNLPSGAGLLDGEVVELDAGEYLESLQLMPSALPEFQNQIDNWFVNAQRDQSAFPGVTGEEPKASTPMGSLQLQAAQGASIFNKRRDQDGFFLGGEVIVDWVIPFIVKKINKEHKLTAAYSRKELKMLDEAITEWHASTKAREAVLSALDKPIDQPVFGEGYPDKEQFKVEMQTTLDKQGKERTLFIPKGFITTAKIEQKIRFDITDEMSDDQRQLNALASALSQLPPGDPARIPLVQEMMEYSGISSASFDMASSPTAGAAPQSKPTRVNEVLPAGQQA